MKRPYIKDRKEFDKVAKNYGFEKVDIGEVYEKWYKRVGTTEIYIFNLSHFICFMEKDRAIFKGKKYLEKIIEKYVGDISHLIEWR